MSDFRRSEKASLEHMTWELAGSWVHCQCPDRGPQEPYMKVRTLRTHPSFQRMGKQCCEGKAAPWVGTSKDEVRHPCQGVRGLETLGVH